MGPPRDPPGFVFSMLRNVRVNRHPIDTMKPQQSVDVNFHPEKREVRSPAHAQPSVLPANARQDSRASIVTSLRDPLPRCCASFDLTPD